MKIFYDYQILFSQQRGGISRYFFELYHVMSAKYSNVRIYLSALFSKNEYFSDIIPIRKYLQAEAGIINEFVNTVNLLFHKYDIIHPTDYCPNYLFRFPFLLKKSKLIITVHDMTHEILIQDQIDFINKKKKIIDMADGIIAVSENTKNDLVRIYPFVKEKAIRVIYHGNSLEKMDIAIPVDIPDRYILYVGHRLGYKNFNCFVESLSMMREKIAVFCVGGDCFTPAEDELFRQKGVKEYMMQKSLTDNELLYVYQHAEFLVFPSLYEGFGMPILEAFGAGCPVILSDRSCFEEIAGNAALYFEGENPNALLLKMEKLLNDQNLREKLILLGKQRAKDFSWDKAATETYNFYREILGEKWNDN